MEQHIQDRKTGSYTANLLGNIRSHLAGLQGYDVMALELIQNADDAKAEEIVFDITDTGLLVCNSGQFTYCGDLYEPCASLVEKNYKCRCKINHHTLRSSNSLILLGLQKSGIKTNNHTTWLRWPRHS